MGVNSSGITNFYNYGIIDGYLEINIWSGQAGDLGYDIKNLYNYGTMGHLYSARAAVSATNVYNYGTMGGLGANRQKTFILDNRGIIEFKLGTKYHFENINLVITNYSMIINKDADSFNSFDGQNAIDNSHIVFSGTSSNVSFKDSSSKIILDFGNKVEMGKGYLLSQLLKTTNNTTALNVDFGRLTTRSELYTLTQSGDKFIVNLADSKTAGYSTIGSLYKSNIRTMNNFYTMSNAMIYPHKFTKKRVVKKKRVRRIKRTAESSFQGDYVESRPLSSLRENERSEFSWQSTDSLESLELLESFAYKTDSNNMNQTKRQSANRRMSQTLPNQNNNYYFVLTPFINHNYFFESGRYNLSGLEYGFLTAFSGKLTQNNALGVHFAFSYGMLGDSNDKAFQITTMSLMTGLNYKLDMIFDMYIKARGDFFYFLNQVQNLSMPKALKPNNVGFGLSVAYGKDFNFKDNGILGIEVGLDYKGLKTTTITTHNNGDSTINESFSKALYHLLYIDLGLNYAKYFNTSIGLWGLNANAGIKGNLTANTLAKSKVILNNTHSINMTIDNDNVLGYVNIAGSYVLNHKDFDMEFSLAYYGNYGDRVISNGGGMEWRVVW